MALDTKCCSASNLKETVFLREGLPFDDFITEVNFGPKGVLLLESDESISEVEGLVCKPGDNVEVKETRLLPTLLEFTNENDPLSLEGLKHPSRVRGLPMIKSWSRSNSPSSGMRYMMALLREEDECAEEGTKEGGPKEPFRLKSTSSIGVPSSRKSLEILRGVLFT